MLLDINSHYLEKVYSTLNEVSYRMPSSGEMAFADFYTLYQLWFMYGSGKSAYGYKSESNPIPSKLSVRIDRMFEESAIQLGKKLSEKSLEAIYSEMENIVDEYVIPDQRSLKSYLERNNIILPTSPTTGEMVLPNEREFWSKYGLSGAYKMFDYPGWVNPQSDLYGGKRWVGIVVAVQQLVIAWKNDRGKNTVKNIAYAIDKLLDIEHNTGMLGDKLGPLSISKEWLNKRFAARTFDDHIKLGTSPMVTGMVRAVLHLDKDDATLTEAKIQKPDTWDSLRKSL